MFLSMVGAANAGYLLVRHGRLAAPVAGGITPAFCPATSCDAVTQGAYAEIAGIPLAAIGLAGYVTLLGLSLLGWVGHTRPAAAALVTLSGVGLAVSVYLVHLQLNVIEAICSWCMLSALTMLSIFVASILWCRALRSPLDPQGATAGQAASGARHERLLPGARERAE
jgi:uncharacterized membrane protein